VIGKKMERLLTSSYGRQPTRYSMSHNDAITDGKRKKFDEKLMAIIYSILDLSI
jgi:hypothetical protein